MCEQCEKFCQVLVLTFSADLTTGRELGFKSQVSVVSHAVSECFYSSQS